MASSSDKSNEFPTQKKKIHLKNFQRFPRLFKESAAIIREVRDEGKSIKTALYSKKLPGACLRKIYGLTCGVMKNLKLVDQVIEKADLLSKIPLLKQEAAEIMVYELAIKKHILPGESKPVQMIRKFEADIYKAYEECFQDDADVAPSHNGPLSNPKYLRVNTLRFSVSQVVNILLDTGFQQLEVEPTTRRKRYREILQSLKKGEFVQDLHFPDILVFSHQENVMIDFPLRHCIHVFIQNKASYIASAALNPPKYSTVLDCCAAPGMKTVHISSIMENSGQIYAVDKNESRLEMLRKIIDESGAQNCQPIHKDFLKIDPTVKPYSKVEYILLDPSCSGSGIVSRAETEHDEDSYCEERVEKLARFQIILLKHALSFPSLKRLVYSTCSVYEKENECIIDEALKTYSEKFKVVKTLPDISWKNRGSKNYEFGKLCLRASYKRDLTNGFFVSVIERNVMPLV